MQHLQLIIPSTSIDSSLKNCLLVSLFVMIHFIVYINLEPYPSNKIHREFLRKSRWENLGFIHSRTALFVSCRSFSLSLSLSDYFLLSFCRSFSPFSSLCHDSDSSARRLSEISFPSLPAPLTA